MNLKVNGKGPDQTPDPVDSGRTPMMLVNELSRLMGKRIQENGLPHPISQRSGQIILFELAKRDGRTQLDLSNATHLKAPTISVSLQKLERDGYVTRRPDEYDLRATRVFLTEKGRELDNTLRQQIRREEALAISCLTDEETQTLIRLLCKIKDNLIGDESEEDRF